MAQEHWAGQTLPLWCPGGWMPTDTTHLGSVMERLGKTYLAGNLILLLQHSAVLGPNLILFCTV